MIMKAFRLRIEMILSQKEKYLRNICIPLINVNKIKTVNKTHLEYPHTPTYRSKFKAHTKVKNVHNMLSLGYTNICQNLVCLCQRAKRL